MPTTALQLKTAIRQQVFPSGEQENLLSGHDQIFQEAFAEIAKWVECEQTDNVDVKRFCNTNFIRGMTAVGGPEGVIRRVYTVANQDFLDPIFYTEVDYEYLRMWAIYQLGMVGLLPDSPTVYPLGFQPANSSTDCACGRARVGYWAKNKGNIYTAPWLQSMEFLIVEWDGVKTVWGNDDVVTPTQEYKKAIKEFFQFGHERDYGSPQRMAMFYNPNSNPRTGLFADTLAALMWQCREKRKQRPTPERPDNRRARGQGTLAVIERGLPPAAPPETGLHGHGPPDVSLGVDGDTYVDDDSQALFWKSGGVWKP